MFKILFFKMKAASSAHRVNRAPASFTVTFAIREIQPFKTAGLTS